MISVKDLYKLAISFDPGCNKDWPIYKQIPFIDRIILPNNFYIDKISSLKEDYFVIINQGGDFYNTHCSFGFNGDVQKFYSWDEAIDFAIEEFKLGIIEIDAKTVAIALKTYKFSKKGEFVLLYKCFKKILVYQTFYICSSVYGNFLSNNDKFTIKREHLASCKNELKKMSLEEWKQYLS